jgi:hypothetical protein
LASIVTSLAVAACVLPATRFETQVETIGVNLPVVVLDHTRLVAAVAPEVPAGRGIRNMNGQPDVLVVGWSGGACDTQATFDFRTAGTGYVLELATHRRPGPCEEAQVGWSVGLVLTSPLEAARVTFVPGP